MSRIMVALGSPREESNTKLLAQIMSEAATNAGAEVETVDAARMAIGPCTACFGCDKSGKFECVIEDDMKPLYAKFPNVDVLVLATPVYWYGPTAQIKAFMDRLYACVRFNAETHGFDTCFPEGMKMAALITAGGDAFDGADLIVNMIRHAAQGIGFGYAGTLLAARCTGPDAIRGNAALMQQARDFGRSLA